LSILPVELDITDEDVSVRAFTDRSEDDREEKQGGTEADKSTVSSVSFRGKTSLVASSVV
jgi:hypothetical protein